jgi:hypothetical protein
MIEHIVLFRCKESCSEETRNQIVAYARSMQSHIPEILYISSGKNWSERGDGFELALVSRFKDKATLDVYQKHPYHQTFVTEWVKPNVDKVLAIDYFID